MSNATHSGVGEHELWPGHVRKERHHKQKMLYLRRIRRWLPADRAASIADVGCGDGGLLRALKQSGYSRLCGVDIDAERAKAARCEVPSVKCGDATAFLRGHPRAFDVITAIDLIEHLRKDRTMSFLRSCASALRPGGRLIVQTPNAASPWVGALRYGDVSHETCFTPESLANLLSDAGFAEVETVGTPPLVHSAASLVRAALWWAAFRPFLHLWNAVETGRWRIGIYTRTFLVCARAPQSMQSTGC